MFKKRIDWSIHDPNKFFYFKVDGFNWITKSDEIPTKQNNNCIHYCLNNNDLYTSGTLCKQNKIQEYRLKLT